MLCSLHTFGAFSDAPADGFCLVDAGLSGNFIYQVRRHDPERHLWVLRSDRILYSVLLTPSVFYENGSQEDEELLQTIYEYDPALVVIEEPRTFSDTPAAQRLRRLVASHGERFRLEKIIPVETNYQAFAGTELKIYRNLIRNPQAREQLELDIPGLDLSLSEETGS